MEKYQAMKEQIKKDEKVLEIASKKTSELDKSIIDIKNAINNFKKEPIIKNTYTISDNEKNKSLENFKKKDDFEL